MLISQVRSPKREPSEAKDAKDADAKNAKNLNRTMSMRLGEVILWLLYMDWLKKMWSKIWMLMLVENLRVKCDER